MRIASISGGGIRGIIPSLILIKLEQITGRHTTELFDLFIGTSTGAMISAVLNCPSEDPEKKWKYSAQDLLDVYIKEAITTFESSMWRKFTTVNGIYGPLYYTKNRDDRFKAWLGEVKIGDTVKDIVVTSYDMCTQSPIFFKTRKARDEQDENHLLVDVIKAASAAPSVFPPHQIKNRIYIDALHGKDPSLFGVIEALKHYGATLNDIQLLSLGTGYTEKQVEPKQVVTSGPSFLIEVFSNMVNANTLNVPYMIEQLLAGDSKMLKLDVPILEQHMGICDTRQSNIEYLIETTRNYINANEQLIEQFAERLLPREKWKTDKTEEA